MDEVIVIDFGSAFVKVGIAGEAYPRYIIPTSSKLSTFGVDLRNNIGVEELEQLLRTTFKHIKRQLMIFDESNRKILICEDLMLPVNVKRAMIKILFGYFKYESISWLPNSLLASCAAGLERALVVDLGFNQTSVVPVYDGFVLYEYHSLFYRSAPPNSSPDWRSEELKIEQLLRASPSNDVDGALQLLFTDSDSNCILDSLLSAPLTIRKEIAGGILLCGGNALIPGLSDSIYRTITQHLTNNPKYKSLLGLKDCIALKKTKMPTNVLSWIGGSIIASAKVTLAVQSKREDFISSMITVPDWTRSNQLEESFVPK